MHETRPPAELPYMRGIPQPTSGPMFAALGVTLLFAGMVTTMFVSAVGAIVAAVGLWRWCAACFPEESLHPLPPGSELPEPDQVGTAGGSGQVAGCSSAGGVSTGVTGQTKSYARRATVPAEVHPYRSGIVGGLAGAVAMAAVGCAWGIVEHSSIWLPINLLAGMVSPAVVAASPADLCKLDVAWLLLALMIHLALSVFVGLLYAVCLPIMPRRPLLFGGLVAPVFITGIAWSTLGIVNPALEQFISWPWFASSQVAFGVVCGYWVSRSERISTMVGFGIAERLHIESGKEAKRD